MPEERPVEEPNGSSFRKTLVRVLIVQIVALAFLAVLQLRYHG